MFSILKAAIAGVLGGAVAIARAPSYAMTATETTSDQANISRTEIQILESTADSAKLKVKDGTIKENADGTVTVSNDAAWDSVTLKSAVLLSDGSISNIDYVVDGDEIHSTLSVPVAAGESEPVADQGWADCAFGTIGTIVAIGAIPVTGGASAVILPALGAGATAGGTVYNCVSAAKG